MYKNTSTTRYLIAFIAGFLAVLFFHQGMLGILHAINFTPRTPFSTAPTKPLGVPQIWSSAFWGGVWGLVFAAVVPRFPRGDRALVSRITIWCFSANVSSLVCRHATERTASCRRLATRDNSFRVIS